MVKVLYVEKREAFAGKGRELLHEFRDVLMIPNVESVRVINRYLVEDLSDDAFATAKECIFSEPPTDDVYEEMDLDGKLVIASTGSASIQQLRELMLQLGCVEAVNLDGGGSTALAYQGKLIRSPGRELTTTLQIFTH